MAVEDQGAPVGVQRHFQDARRRTAEAGIGETLVIGVKAAHRISSMQLAGNPDREERFRLGFAPADGHGELGSEVARSGGCFRPNTCRLERCRGSSRGGLSIIPERNVWALPPGTFKGRTSLPGRSIE